MGWRPAVTGDLDAIDDIAGRVHPQLPEHPEVLAEKFRLFPTGCQVIEQDGKVLGYGLSHPWLIDEIPPLNGFLHGLPASPECLYIHDVAILPQARGADALAGYVERVCRLAMIERLNCLALVSVYGTDTLWSRHGFEAADQSAVAAKLSSYGETARYLIRKL